MAYQRWFGPLALQKLFLDCSPGALPQTGIASGLWPVRTYAHPTSKGQRPDPSRPGQGPGIKHLPQQQGPKAKGLSHTRPGQGPGIQHPCPPKGLKARPIRSTPTMRKTVPILSWTATTLTPSITRSLSSLSRPALIPVGAYSTRLRNFPQIKDHRAGYRTLRSTRGCGRSYSGGTRSPRSRRSLARGSW